MFMQPYLILQYWKTRLPEAYAKETSRYCLFENFENWHTCDLKNLQDFRRKRCHCKSQRSCDLWFAPLFYHMVGNLLVSRQNWLSDPRVTDLPKLPQSRNTDGIQDNPCKQKWICHFLRKFSQILPYSVHLGFWSRYPCHKEGGYENWDTILCRRCNLNPMKELMGQALDSESKDFAELVIIKKWIIQWAQVNPFFWIPSHMYYHLAYFTLLINLPEKGQKSQIYLQCRNTLWYM